MTISKTHPTRNLISARRHYRLISALAFAAMVGSNAQRAGDGPTTSVSMDITSRNER